MGPYITTRYCSAVGAVAARCHLSIEPKATAPTPIHALFATAPGQRGPQRIHELRHKKPARHTRNTLREGEASPGGATPETDNAGRAESDAMRRRRFCNTACVVRQLEQRHHHHPSFSSCHHLSWYCCRDHDGISSPLGLSTPFAGPLGAPAPFHALGQCESDALPTQSLRT